MPGTSDRAPDGCPLCGPAINALPSGGDSPPGGESLPTSLDPIETTEQFSLEDTHAQARLHTPWYRARISVVRALEGSYDGKVQKRAQRLRDCCRYPRLILDKAGRPKVAAVRCRDRLCPRCGWLRGFQNCERIETLVGCMDSPRLVTLTLRSSATPLGEQLKRLHAHFRSLRRTVQWKQRVKWGVCVLELTRNEETGQWHPHLHCVVDGVYWEQKSLAAAWLAVSGDSSIVDIRAVHSRSKASDYLAKYLTKGLKVENMDEATILELAEALHGVRLVSVVGTRITTAIDATDPNIEQRTCTELVSIADIDTGVLLSRPDAIRLVRLLRRSCKAAFRLLKEVGACNGEEEEPPQPGDDRRILIAAMNLKHEIDTQHDPKRPPAKPKNFTVASPLLFQDGPPPRHP